MGVFRSLGVFLRDLYADGFKLLGALAPVASLVITGLKYFEVPVVKEFSFAWAFAPLALWFLIAYIRQRNRFNKIRGPYSLPNIRVKNPHFREEEVHLADKPHLLIIPFQNIGEPASCIDLAIVGLQSDNWATVLTSRFLQNSEFGKDEESNWSFDAQLPPNSPPVFFVLAIKSVGMGGDERRQVKFMRWDGSKDGIVKPDLNQIDAEQKAAVEQHLKGVEVDGVPFTNFLPSE